MNLHIGHLLKDSTIRIDRLAILATIVALLALPALRMEVPGYPAEPERNQIVSSGAEHERNDRFEPFLFGSSGWMFRGSDAQVVVDRIPERKTGSGDDAFSDIFAHERSAPPTTRSILGSDLEGGYATLPLFRIHEALLI